ncbi:MAG: DUF4294 domain-containing protein [Bacteroidetes bacterium HGW-Bacteroidetes-17]|nr:MAG: DUF4294 domain-containing protein [Bacteroidetes bacterium HGW-Bacteroidetes-17]
MRKQILILFFVLFYLSQLMAQDKKVVSYAKIVNGDTIPVVQLNEVNVSAYRIVEKNEFRQMTRLIRNIKKVYPYAKIAGLKLKEYNDILLQTPDEKEQKKILKRAEQELKDEFGEDLKKLTFSQGKILIKLIDRETGNCSFDLVKELRGGFTAFFYQAFARIFGYNLKEKYDPKGEDSIIELIVMMIENGSI